MWRVTRFISRDQVISYILCDVSMSSGERSCLATLTNAAKKESLSRHSLAIIIYNILPDLYFIKSPLMALKIIGGHIVL